MQEEIVKSAINRLGPFFRKGDEDVIKDIVNDMISIAFSCSNRTENNGKELILLIKKATIAAYKLRGTEGIKNLSQSGKSMSFEEIEDKLKTEIIKGRLRLLK